jgi:hypothetical protein
MPFVRFGKRVAREVKELDGDDSHACRPGFDHPRLETALVRKGLLIKRKRWPPVRPQQGILNSQVVYKLRPRSERVLRVCFCLQDAGSVRDRP